MFVIMFVYTELIMW